MKISKEQVLYVANLARLKLDEASIETFAGQLATILEYMETLDTVSTEGVSPTSHAIFLTNAFRDDVEAAHRHQKAALENAPEQEEGSFLVPKVVG